MSPGNWVLMWHSVPAPSDKSVPKSLSGRLFGADDQKVFRIMTHPRAGGLPRCAGADHGGVTDPDLIRRAQNAGIATSYENWRREWVEVPAETLAAILGVLEDNGKRSETFGTGATVAVQGAAVTDTKPAPPAASPAAAAPAPAAPAPAAAAQRSEPDTARPVVPRARQ